MRAASLLLVALLLPLGAAQAPAHETEAVVLAYRPHPDPRAGQPDADPFSTPRAPLPAGMDRLPTTRLDGILLGSDAPEGNPDSALARFRDTQRLLLLRQRTGAPLVVELGGALAAPGTLRVDVSLEPATPSLGGAPLELRVALFEDGVPDPAGPRLHRHVARALLPPEPVDLASAVRLSREVPLEPSWDARRLGVAAWVVHAGANDTRYAEGEVLQAAAWRVAQEEPTRQARKAVLVEQATAAWCDACRAADEGLALVASQFGADPMPAAGAAGAYLVRPTPLAYAGLALGAFAGIVLLRRRGA